MSATSTAASRLDLLFMAAALAQARRAALDGEVPVGAVVACAGQLVARAHNRPLAARDPTAHAEMVALRRAARRIGNYRLIGCTMYSTLEPCAMCAAALVHARIERLVYAAPDAKAGAVRSRLRLLSRGFLNHRVEVTSGVRAAEAAELLRSFFRARRGQR